MEWASTVVIRADRRVLVWLGFGLYLVVGVVWENCRGWGRGADGKITESNWTGSVNVHDHHNNQGKRDTREGTYVGTE